MVFKRIRFHGCLPLACLVTLFVWPSEACVTTETFVQLKIFWEPEKYSICLSLAEIMVGGNRRLSTGFDTR